MEEEIEEEEIEEEEEEEEEMEEEEEEKIGTKRMLCSVEQQNKRKWMGWNARRRGVVG